MLEDRLIKVQASGTLLNLERNVELLQAKVNTVQMDMDNRKGADEDVLFEKLKGKFTPLFNKFRDMLSGAAANRFAATSSDQLGLSAALDVDSKELLE